MSDVQMLPTLASLSALVPCACGRGHLCSSQVCMAGNVATPGCTGRIRCLPAGVAIHGGTARGSRRDCCRCHCAFISKLWTLSASATRRARPMMRLFWHYAELRSLGTLWRSGRSICARAARVLIRSLEFHG
jgi:hypothetical protein